MRFKRQKRQKRQRKVILLFFLLLYCKGKENQYYYRENIEAVAVKVPINIKLREVEDNTFYYDIIKKPYHSYNWKWKTVKKDITLKNEMIYE